VTKQGTIIYRVGASAVRDEGDTFRVSRGAELEAMQAALRMAFERFGKTITVKGSDAFKEKIVIAAAAADLPIVFDDPELQQRRLQLANRTTRSENRVDDAGTRSPVARGSEGPGPLNARTTQTRNPNTPQKPKSALHARSIR
jgi:hypothetical protein